MKLSRRDLIKAFALGAAGLMLPKGVIADEPIKKYWQGVSLPPQPYQEPEFPLNKYQMGMTHGEVPFGIHASEMIPDDTVIMASGKIIGIAIDQDHIMYHRELSGGKHVPVAVHHISDDEWRKQHAGLLQPFGFNRYPIAGPIHAGDFVALGADGKVRRADPNSYAILRGLGG